MGRIGADPRIVVRERMHVNLTGESVFSRSDNTSQCLQCNAAILVIVLLSHVNRNEHEQAL